MLSDCNVEHPSHQIEITESAGQITESATSDEGFGY